MTLGYTLKQIGLSGLTWLWFGIIALIEFLVEPCGDSVPVIGPRRELGLVAYKSFYAYICIIRGFDHGGDLLRFHPI